MMRRKKGRIRQIRRIRRIGRKLDSPSGRKFDYRLEHDEKFLRRIARAREDIRKDRFVSLEDLPG